MSSRESFIESFLEQIETQKPPTTTSFRDKGLGVITSGSTEIKVYETDHYKNDGRTFVRRSYSAFIGGDAGIRLENDSYKELIKIISAFL
jgi:hypothetical protein